MLRDCPGQERRYLGSEEILMIRAYCVLATLVELSAVVCFSLAEAWATALVFCLILGLQGICVSNLWKEDL